MNMKKLVPAAITALLLGSAVVVPGASASEQQPKEVEVPQIQIDPVHIFNNTLGTVDDVRVGKNIMYYTVKGNEQTNVLEITKDTLVFDNAGKKVELKKGDKIVAYTFANKSQKEIYPPQFNPEIVIVESEEVGLVEFDYFFETLTNTYGILKLNISKETEVLNSKGEKIEPEELVEKNLAVFYTTSTESMPAQTTPTKVIVIDDLPVNTTNPVNEEIDNIIALDSYEVAGTKMVPLRMIAEKLGYKVESTGKGAILSKGNMSYTITRGEKTFGYNKAMFTLSVAPTLKNTKTYVPVDFVEEYLK